MKKLAVIGFSLLVACGIKDESNEEETTENKKPKVEQLVESGINLTTVRHMEGTWIDASGNMPGFHEKWVADGDSLIQVIGYFVNEKDTAIMEVIKVKMVDGILNYIPKVENQNDGAEVFFAIQDGSSADSLVFANYNHDFPREITYVKRTIDTVDVYLRGVTKEGEPQEYVLKLCKR